MLLIERLRAALAPDYDVERELAGGGMGIVFSGRHCRLNHPVAIKVLRPELATATAAERFLIEGRVLAKLSHPNIVRVYDAGEADGLLYYVMELIEGETLADRLSRGPLSAHEALDFTRDLLAALGTAHAQGVVHRDIKPANIFLRQGQTLLADFGVASWRSDSDGLTTPGQMIGTLRYMPPEARDGSEVTGSADVYAAGMVIYEACAGVHWPAYQVPGEADWRMVPRVLVAPLKRALAIAPEERWPDGNAFRQVVTPRQRSLAGPLLAAGVVLAAIAAAIWLVPRGQPAAPVVARTGVTLALARIAVHGQPGRSGLGDSVRTALVDALSGFPDFSVLPGSSGGDSLAFVITGTGNSDGSALSLQLTMRAPHAQSIQFPIKGREEDWHGLTDTLVNRLARAIWQRVEGGNRDLPLAAIPRSDNGFSLWLKAEQYLSQARWDEADTAYTTAEHEDSTCYLCWFRRLDIDRWVGPPQDSAGLALLGRVRDSFPARYQSLINAALTPLPWRLDTLRVAAETYPTFFLASFEYGDELFHRGPLYGHPRHEAIEPLHKTVQLRPRFGPGWEHLTWALLSEGDSASTVAALDSLEATKVGSGLSAGLRMLLTLGVHWRFFSPDSAARFSSAVLHNLGVLRNPDAVAGARLLMTTDAPNGAVAFGSLLTTMRAWRTEAVGEGLLGQMYGYAALGKLDSLRAVGLRLSRETTDPSLPLLALELEAILRRFDPEPSVRTAPGLVEVLRVYLPRGAYDRPLRWRVGWALGLLASGTGDSALLATALGAVFDEPALSRMRRTLEASDLAARNKLRDALRALPDTIGYDVLPGDHESPLDDTAARLLAAEWAERQIGRDSARKALLWQEHLHHHGHLTGPPQRAEGSWAVSTLARWRLAQLFRKGEAARCAALASVERRWKQGEPVFAKRADSARAILELECKRP